MASREAVVIAGHRLNGSWMAAAFALLGAAVAVAVTAGVPWWLVAAGIIGPDLSFLAGIGARPDRPGLMPRRVVPVYNAAHSWVGPVVLLAATPVIGGPAPLVLALAWAAHLAWDRGVGYGLRAPDGSLR